jgi:hypothetical protein
MLRKKKKQKVQDRIVTRSPGQFIQFSQELRDSEAYRSLKPGARCLLIELMMLVWPDRNGKIGMSHAKASLLIGCSKKTAGKYFEMLLSRGFIKVEKGELWQERLAREYSLTMATRQGRQPSHEYLSWTEGMNTYGGNKKLAGVKETPELG